MISIGREQVVKFSLFSFSCSIQTEWESEMYMERLENVAAIANQPTRQAMTDFLANAFKFGMV